MNNKITIGIIIGSDFTRHERGGGGSGFINNILPKLSITAKIFGIGYSDVISWREVPIKSNVSFISIGSLNQLSDRIPKRLPTLLLYLYHRDRILRSGVDALYIHSPECALPFVIFKSQLPVVFHQHGSANPVSTATFKWARNPLFTRIFDNIHRIIYKRADWIIAIDRLCLEQAEKNGAGQKVSLIMNAVDTENFRPDEISRKQTRYKYGCTDNDLILFFAGRLEEVKRVDKIIDSLIHMNEKYNVKLFIAGDGKLRKVLERQVRENQLTPNVFFLGYVAHNQLYGLYNMADVLLLSSIMEGTPMVVLEALACGTPVIATRVGGIPDLIEDGKNGILLDNPSPQEIAEAITRIAESSYDRHMIADSVSRWSSDNVVEELTMLFSKLVQR